jgi:hypothetical protein
MTTSKSIAPNEAIWERPDRRNRAKIHRADAAAFIRADLTSAIIDLRRTYQDRDDDYQLLLLTAAANARCTGTLPSFLSRIAKRRARLILAHTVSLGETTAFTGYIACPPSDKAAVIREIGDEPRATVEGIPYPDGEPHQLRIAHRENLDLTQKVFEALDELRIYPRNCKFMLCAPPWAELGWPDRDGDPTFRSMANIAMQIDVPSGITPERIVERIRRAAPQEDWDIRCGTSRGRPTDARD